MSDFSSTDLAWAAGFLDGEGCFRPDHATDTKGTERWPCNLSAGQVCPAPIYRLQHLFGGGLLEHKQRGAIYWRILGSGPLKEILPEIIPFLTVKRADALKLLEFANTFADRGKPRITPETRNLRHEIAANWPYAPTFFPLYLPRELGLAWSGGFLDAEGCFTLSDPHNGYSHPSVRSLLVSASQKDYSTPLLRLLSTFQVGRIHGPNVAGAYHWIVSKAQDVIKVIDEVDQFLSVKKHEAQIVRAFATEVGYRGKRELPPDVIDRRMKLIADLAEVRGV